MTESQFQILFNTWKKHNRIITCVEELKICKEDKFYFNKIADHQLSNLYNAKHDFVQYKLPDLGMQNPFDSCSFCEVPAHVVIMWYKIRQPKKFYAIDIDIIKQEINKGIKSLTEQRASEICDFVGELK